MDEDGDSKDGVDKDAADLPDGGDIGGSLTTTRMGSVHLFSSLPQA